MPSRASILAGEYSPTTGVFGNHGRYRGFEAFTNAGDDQHTIATDLRSNGYGTALIGKYLNGYPKNHFKYVPPAWDRWFGVPTSSHYDYAASDQGRLVIYGGKPSDYSTRVLASQALHFIDRTLAGIPFFRTSRSRHHIPRQLPIRSA